MKKMINNDKCTSKFLKKLAAAAFLICSMQPVFAQDLEGTPSDESLEEITRAIEGTKTDGCQLSITEARKKANAMAKNYSGEFGYFLAVQKRALSDLVKQILISKDEKESLERANLLQGVLKLENLRQSKKDQISALNQELKGQETLKNQFLSKRKAEIDSTFDDSIDETSTLLDMAREQVAAELKSFDETERAPVEKQLKDVSHNIEVQRTNSEQLNTTIEENMKKISTLESTIKDKKAKAKAKTAAKKQIKELNAEIGQLSAQRSTLSTEVQALNDQATGLKAQLTTVSTNRSAKASELAERVTSEPAGKLEDLKAQKAKALKEMEELASKEAFTAKIANLTKQIEGKETSVKLLSDSIGQGLSKLKLNEKLLRLSSTTLSQACEKKNIFSTDGLAYQSRYHEADAYRRFSKDSSSDKNCVDGIEIPREPSIKVQVCNNMPVKSNAKLGAASSYKVCSTIDLANSVLGADAVINKTQGTVAWFTPQRIVDLIEMQLQEKACVDQYLKLRAEAKERAAAANAASMSSELQKSSSAL